MKRFAIIFHSCHCLYCPLTLLSSLFCFLSLQRFFTVVQYKLCVFHYRIFWCFHLQNIFISKIFVHLLIYFHIYNSFMLCRQFCCCCCRYLIMFIYECLFHSAQLSGSTFSVWDSRQNPKENGKQRNCSCRPRSGLFILLAT